MENNTLYPDEEEWALENLRHGDLEACTAHGDEINNSTNGTDGLIFTYMQLRCCMNCSFHSDCMMKYLPYKCQDNPFALAWYLQFIYIVAFVSMVLVAAGGNIIVIWIVLAHKRMRTVTNYFLVNLAVADAAISLLNTLFNFVYMMYQNWPFGRFYCKFCLFISNGTISASVFTFMAIALERYLIFTILRGISTVTKELYLQDINVQFDLVKEFYELSRE